MELREYQYRTIEMIRNAIRSGYKRILVTLPTGSGKSIIMGHIAKLCRDKGRRVLALMHRRQLVEQLQDRFNECGVSSGLIMSGVSSDLASECQIGTIQTYSRRIKLEEADFWSDNKRRPWLMDANVVFLDECHRSLSKTFQDVMGEYENKIVLGFTATPSLSSGVAMGNYYETLIQPVSVKELIRGGSLVPGRYYGLNGPDLSELRVIAGDYERGELGKRVMKQKIIGDIVQNWCKLSGNRKTILFAVNVKHSIAITREFKKYEINAEHLDAHSTDDERNEVLSRFRRGEIRVLCNVDLYTEGTDIPDIECICLARPTKSIGRYIQMVGRGARPFDKKDYFLVLDHGANVNEHGFYEDNINWTLDGKKIKFAKTHKNKREKHKLTCDICSCVFTGSMCPQCHTVVVNYGKKIEAMEAELKELNKKEVKYTFEDKKRWYSMFKYEKIRLNKSDGWLLAQYKSKFNTWPNKCKHEPAIEPNEEVLNWLKYQRIKWAKGKANAERKRERALV